jgi:hypothetical protein
MIINDETFARLVADNIKNRTTTAQNKYLELPENSYRWQRALNALIRNLDEQINQINLDAQSDSDRYSQIGDAGAELLTQAISHYDAKKQKIERFRFYVVKKLADVVMSGKVNNSVAQDGDSIVHRAVRKHMSMGQLYGIEQTPLDRALYKALEGIWSFDDLKEEDLLEFSDHAPTL